MVSYMINGNEATLIDEFGTSHVIYVDDGDGSLVYARLHKIGGPARIRNDGVLWCVNGVSYNSTREYCEACEFDEEITVFWLLKYGESLPHRMLQTPGVSVVITHD